MTLAQIDVGNTRSQIRGLPPELFRLLRHELSFMESEPGTRQFLQADGSIKISHWDGYRRLLTNSGIFPSGLIPRAARLLHKWGVVISINDKRQQPVEALPLWKFPPELILRDYQVEACDAAEAQGRGVVDSPPRTGKTLMMLELVRRMACPTVITAPTEAVTSQTYERMLEVFTDWYGQIDCKADFCKLSGGPPKSRKAWQAVKKATVFVATAETAVAMPQIWWDRIQCLIVDERHHQAAKTYRRMNDLATNAYWRWGFTGTNFRSNPGEQVALEACLGRTVASYSIPEMTGRKILVPARVIFYPIDYPGMKSHKFSRAYKAGIIDSAPRNAAVVHAARELLSQGRKVLILVHQIVHGEALQERIPGSRFVQGSDGAEVRSAVAQLDDGSIQCLIGSPVVGEGLDCPAADALIYAKGYKAKVTHIQDTFRVLTASEGKTEAVIVDFADRHNKTLLSHSVERMKNYQHMGMTVEVAPQLPIDNAQLNLYQ